jgi:hypothetical protein
VLVDTVFPCVHMKVTDNARTSRKPSNSSMMIEKHGSWVNLKGGGQLAVKTGNGTHMRGMVPGLGSVIGCPHSPPETSARCVWTQVPYEHAQPYIRAVLMMGVFSCVCSGVLWGRVGLKCQILGGVIVSFLGGAGEGKRKRQGKYC